MKLPKISRRKFIWSVAVGMPAAAAADVFWVEPKWVRIRRICLSREKPKHRFIHFTDLHHKGNARYLRSVINTINGLSPEFVCFTGDIMEATEHLGEALAIMRKIKAPLYGVPGNHDYWSHADFAEIAESFAATGGSWLLDRQVMTRDGQFNIVGATCEKPAVFDLHPTAKNIMLIHYPEWADKLGPGKFHLILAGHSHGGQVRIPFYGPLMLPYGVGKYDLGLFTTAAGPLYVNAGIGYFYIDVRLFCRPEITVFEV